MLPRPALQDRIRWALTRSPAVVLLGPRQVGKTTLARTLVAPDSANYFDLEDPAVEVLLSQPMTALRDLRGLVVIDEVQRAPDLFKVLRVLLDRAQPQAAGTQQVFPAQFLLLGSASPLLLRQAGESLAGRVEIIEIGGFSLIETGPEHQSDLWWRGGFPRSFLAADDAASRQWRRDFIRTLIERDMPQLGVSVPAPAMQRFWAMLAHLHAQVWNAADMARALGQSERGVRHQLDVLTQMFMVRQLQPWFENHGKRQVKSPKIYLRDSGLLHELLAIADPAQLSLHPKVGASWEGLVIEQVIRCTQADEAYFWATHAGAELDLLIFKDGRRLGIEIKRMDAPRLTRSMSTAVADLGLDRLEVIYPGQRRYRLAERIEAVPLADWLIQT